MKMACDSRLSVTVQSRWVSHWESQLERTRKDTSDHWLREGVCTGASVSVCVHTVQEVWLKQWASYANARCFFIWDIACVRTHLVNIMVPTYALYNINALVNAKVIEWRSCCFNSPFEVSQVSASSWRGVVLCSITIFNKQQTSHSFTKSCGWLHKLLRLR